MSNRSVIEAACWLGVSPFWLLGIVDDPLFDWQGPAMSAGQYERASELRSALAAFDWHGPDLLLEEYPADYRDPDQLLADAISYQARRRTESDKYTPIMDILLSHQERVK